MKTTKRADEVFEAEVVLGSGLRTTLTLSVRVYLDEEDRDEHRREVTCALLDEVSHLRVSSLAHAAETWGTGFGDHPFTCRSFSLTAPNCPSSNVDVSAKLDCDVERLIAEAEALLGKRR